MSNFVVSMFFSRAMDTVFAVEGGYVDDEHDAGGQTKYGISKAQYPNLDIANLTKEDARAIYERDYWNRYRCGELPWCFALLLFDSVVNHHPTNPIKWLQRAVGATPDGVIGPRTIAAAHACRDKPEAVANFLLARLEHFESRPNYARYADGWRKRLFKVALAAGSLGG